MSKYVVTDTLTNTEASQTLEYGKYARQFDQMCELLPVYQDNIDYLIRLLPQFKLPNDAKICDLGAGTGNFICALADKMPDAYFTHVDANPTMNSYAQSKYDRLGIEHVNIVENYIQRTQFQDNQFDLVISINALNTAAPQLPVLRQIRRWLKPSGTLFLIDFGRKQRVLDWGWYILTNTVKRYGIARYLRALAENGEAIRQNRRASKDQMRGTMWTHTTEEFQSLVNDAGFAIWHVDTCYRGYCDLVVATKPDT